MHNNSIKKAFTIVMESYSMSSSKDIKVDVDIISEVEKLFLKSNPDVSVNNVIFESISVRRGYTEENLDRIIYSLKFLLFEPCKNDIMHRWNKYDATHYVAV